MGDACLTIIEQARPRQGPQRLKSMSGLCASNSSALFVTLAPIGSLRLHGFIVAIVEPSKDMISIGRELGMPVQVSSPKGEALFQSANWPTDPHKKHVIIAAHPLKTDAGQAVLRVSLASDITVLEDDLYRARSWVLTVAGIVTALIALLTLFGLRRALLNPLDNLLQKFQVLERDGKHLGEHVAVTGNREIRLLTHAFNRMTTELGSLYGRLEEMAFRDNLTQLPNRSLLNVQMGEVINQCYGRY